MEKERERESERERERERWHHKKCLENIAAEEDHKLNNKYDKKSKAKELTAFQNSLNGDKTKRILLFKFRTSPISPLLFVTLSLAHAQTHKHTHTQTHTFIHTLTPHNSTHINTQAYSLVIFHTNSNILLHDNDAVVNILI